MVIPSLCVIYMIMLWLWLRLLVIMVIIIVTIGIKYAAEPSFLLSLW